MGLCDAFNVAKAPCDCLQTKRGFSAPQEKPRCPQILEFRDILEWPHEGLFQTFSIAPMKWKRIKGIQAFVKHVNTVEEKLGTV